MGLIELKDIRKTYVMGDIKLPVLKGITMSVEKGDMVALTGVSGSGKSTLMNILGCLDRPTSGEYWLDGEEISRLSNDGRADVRNRKIGFVFQNFNLLPRTTALENVIMPLSYTAGNLSRRECRERGIAMLRRVGLSDRIYHYPSQLSGGQQQRVAIARALVNRPPVLFADEPTGNLDERTGEAVMQMLLSLCSEGRASLLLITHNPDFARRTSRSVRISQGIACEV